MGVSVALEGSDMMMMQVENPSSGYAMTFMDPKVRGLHPLATINA